ncbi:MAG: non-ribosomal peptide synthetase [Desulfobulbaceae bacterium]
MSYNFFWLHHQLHPESSTYNIPAVFYICGSLDIQALEKSIDTVIRRHDVFRITFSEQGEIQKHAIDDEYPIGLEQVHLVGESTPDELKQILTREIIRPFNLKTGPLLRVRLFHLDKDKYVLLLVMHHCITDLRSKELLSAQISTCYDTIVKKRNLPILESAYQYSHFINRRQAWLSSQPAREMLNFWKKEVQNFTGLLDLPVDRPRPPVARSFGKAHFFHISPEQSGNLHEYCRKHSIAPFVALLTCYLVLLARYSRQNRVVVGVPLTNRRQDEDKNTMGCFINILPLAFELHKDLTILHAMHLVRRKLLQAHRNQETSFQDIVSAVNPPREPSYNPIFQVGFTFEPPMELQLTGVKVISEKWHNQGAQLDLFLNIFEMSPGIRGYFEYNQDIFEQETITRICGTFQHLVTSWHELADIRISKVEILPLAVKRKLFDNLTDTSTTQSEGKCIYRIFEKQAALSPSAKAVIFEDTSLTYCDLNERANQLAHYLKGQGVGPEHIVGVLMERSLEMVIALYAIIKAGGAYIPLDPDLPQQRLSFMLNETKVKIILSQQRLRGKIPAFDGTTFNVDTEGSAITDYPRDNPANEATPDNLVYVIYTSGSTGNPKGVMIEHRGLSNRLTWMQETYKLEPGDRVLQKTPFSFDVSVWEFFWPLLTGATLVVAPPNAHKDPKKLSQIIDQHTITTIHFVPSMLLLFLDAGDAANCKSLRRVFCSGEALTWELQSRFLQRLDCSLYNLYGPTEATIDVSYWDCRQQTYPGKVPIGYPVANTQLYILDEALQPVPQGATGELYIGGVQVARGYLQRGELNKTSFIQDPFNISGSGRLYKTGDLARHLPNGAIEYIGRVDFQVKIFGNRIEPMEIEAALCRHPLINSAVVTLIKEPNGKEKLVAYLLSRASSLDELMPRRHLLEILPYYMIPTHYILMKEFPLTWSGKVDRKLLPHPHQEKDGALFASPCLENNFMTLVTSIWQKILNATDIPTNLNFFEAGGDSFLATQLAFELEEKTGANIPLVKIFQYPTISELSCFLEKMNTQSAVNTADDKSRTIKQRMVFEKMKFNNERR